MEKFNQDKAKILEKLVSAIYHDDNDAKDEALEELEALEPEVKRIEFNAFISTFTVFGQYSLYKNNSGYITVLFGKNCQRGIELLVADKLNTIDDCLKAMNEHHKTLVLELLV